MVEPGQRDIRLRATDLLPQFADEQGPAQLELQERARALACDGPPRPHLIAMTLCGEMTSLRHPYWSGVIDGAKELVAASGGELLIMITRGEDANQLPARCARRGVEGAIIMAVGDDAPWLGGILAIPAPLMFVDFTPLRERAGSVSTDNVQGMAAVVGHLHALGRRRIATVTGIPSTRPGSERLLGYRSALAEAGLDERPDYVQEGDFYGRSGYEAALRLLALPEPPDAIACASDMEAIGVIAAIEEYGLRVPEDVAVTGFDDNAFAATMTPALTTVRQDAAGVGTAAAEALLRMVERPELPPPTLLLPAKLVVRESCGGALAAFGSAPHHPSASRAPSAEGWAA